MLSVKLTAAHTRVSETIHFPEPFSLESGEFLSGIDIAYTTIGTLNETRDNVVWVFHALTGNAEPDTWWPGLLGKDKIFDPSEYYIVCANVIGSCYGSTGPVSYNPLTRQPFLNQFPMVTIKDMVKAHQLLRRKLGVEQIKIGIGGSLGGQQLLEWAVDEPYRFEHIVPIATNARHSAWGIAFNETQRMALNADKTFFDGTVGGGKEGLKAARAMAIISYRTQAIYRKKQTDNDPMLDNFSASTYQQYQGQKLSNRFSAHAYYTLSKAMDSHNLGRGRDSVKKALRKIASKALVIGIKSDLLFPVAEQAFISKCIPQGELQTINSIYGHDGFLVEDDQIKQLLTNFIN